MVHDYKDRGFTVKINGRTRLNVSGIESSPGVEIYEPNVYGEPNRDPEKIKSGILGIRGHNLTRT